MTEQPQAGARVRIIIEDTIESRSASGDWTTTGGINLTGVTPNNATTTIVEPGWQPGDIANDGHTDLFRIRREDGVHLWKRPDGQHVHDDQTTLASLTTIHTADAPAATVTMTITSPPDPPELQREIARLRREWRGR